MRSSHRLGLILSITFLVVSFTYFVEALPAGPVNTSKAAGNQTESFIVINPTNPLNIVAFSNEASSLNTFRAYSFDGGSTWTSGDINIGAACCDGQSVMFDQYGNLFLVYLSNSPIMVKLIHSTDGGVTFSAPITLGSGGVDQPSIAAGDGSLWVDWNQGGSMVAAGAPVTGLGTFGPFGSVQTIPSAIGSFGGIAVGPGANGSGKVMVVYQSPTGGQGPATIFANVDPDGLGASGFGSQITITSTNVGGFDFIPAQSSRSIDAESGLAWDATGGPFNNRVYLVYVDETVNENNDTNILVRTSTDDGSTWSSAVKVNDDVTTNSQFNPYISMDEKTGSVGVTFHDARNDTGVSGTGGTNAVVNDDAQYFASYSTDGGATWAANVQLSCGFSNDNAAANGIDYGDYVGTDTYCGVLFGAWADNSNCTGDNPQGTLTKFDLYANALAFLPVDLAVTKDDGGATSSPGGTISYTLGYGNTGRLATGVVLSETVPANTTFNPGASTAGWVCVPDSNAGSTCTLSFGTLIGCGDGAGSVTFAVTVSSSLPAGVTQISNTAKIADDGTNGADANTSDNTSSDTTPITAQPDIAVVKTDNGASSVPGGVVVYSLTVSNHGNQNATGVTLMETVPTGSTFEAASSTAGWSCADGSPAGTSCQFAVGSLNAGASQVVLFAVQVDNPIPPGVVLITNTAAAADDGANGADPNLTDNTSTDTTPLTLQPQTVAIDSQGRFVVFTAAPAGCQLKVLWFQALDASGNPSGSSKQLTACGLLSSDAKGVDLLVDGSAVFISFGGGASDSKYLMKIDAAGKILISAKKMVSPAAFGSTEGATALIRKGSTNISLYIAGGGGAIYVATIDKATLVAGRVRKTTIISADTLTLQSTQGSSLSFLATAQGDRVLTAVGLNNKGLANGTGWRLSPRTDGGHECGGVSPDGRMALSNVSNVPGDQLYTQPLGASGQPVGDPDVIVSDGQDISSVDLTNPLTGNVRFVVYTNSAGLFLRKVNATTGVKMGQPIPLF